MKAKKSAHREENDSQTVVTVLPAILLGQKISHHEGAHQGDDAEGPVMKIHDEALLVRIQSHEKGVGTAQNKAAPNPHPQDEQHVGKIGVQASEKKNTRTQEKTSRHQDPVPAHQVRQNASEKTNDGVTCLTAGCEQRSLFDVDVEKDAHSRERRAPKGEERPHEAERNESGPCHNGAILNHEDWSPCSVILAFSVTGDRHKPYLPPRLPASLLIGVYDDLDRSSDSLGKGSERFLDLPKWKGVSRKRFQRNAAL